MKTVCKMSLSLLAVAAFALFALQPVGADDKPSELRLGPGKPPVVKLSDRPERPVKNPQDAKKQFEACGKALEKISKIMTRSMRTDKSKITETINKYNKACAGITGPLGKRRLPPPMIKKSE